MNYLKTKLIYFNLENKKNIISGTLNDYIIDKISSYYMRSYSNTNTIQFVQTDSKSSVCIIEIPKEIKTLNLLNVTPTAYAGGRISPFVLSNQSSFPITDYLKIGEANSINELSKLSMHIPKGQYKYLLLNNKYSNLKFEMIG